MRTVPDALHPPPQSPPRADRDGADGLTGWLGALLDEARDREEGSLARLIAGVIDDLTAAARR